MASHNNNNTFFNPFYDIFGGVFRPLSYRSPLPPVSTKLLNWHVGAVEDEIYMRDSARVLGDFPIQMVDGVCLTFNGIGEYGSFNGVTLVGDFGICVGIESGDNFSTAGAVLSGDSFNNYIKTGGTQTVKINGTDVVYNVANPTGESTLCVSRVGDQVTLGFEGGTTQTKTINSDDFFLEFTGQYNSANYFNGSLWNIRLSDPTQDCHFPCIGKTNTVNPTSTFATDGTEMTIVSLDYAAIWAGVQQTYFYEVQSGYWEDVNGRYPYAHSGATRGGAGWNLPQNSFEFAYHADLETQDNLEGPFWFTAGTPNAKTQSEIEAHCTDKTATFCRTCKTSMDELLLYNEVLTGEELIRVLYYCCAAEPITFDNETTIFDGEELFMRT